MKHTNSASNAINHRDNQQTPAQIRNAAMGKGVNIDHPTFVHQNDGITEIDIVAENYLGIISELGFTNVRLTFRWQNYWDPEGTEDKEPYKHFDNYATDALKIVDEALSQGLYVIVDLHEFSGDVDTFKAIWARIQSKFVERPEVMFEPLNEPRKSSTFADFDAWNRYLEEFYTLIRTTEPERIIIAGTFKWNDADELKNLFEDIANDEYTIVSLHQYDPHPFTHQGVEDDQYDNSIGTSRWSAIDDQRTAVNSVIDAINECRGPDDRFPNIPINIGEFGANHYVANFEQYNAAPEYSRRRWVEYNAYCFQNEGYSSCYWEFCDGFGFFDKETKDIDGLMVQAILDPHDIPLVPTIIENTDPVDYAIIDSKFSISLTAQDADEFRLQQYLENTNRWEDVSNNYTMDEIYNSDGSKKVTFRSKTITSSSWGSPSAFRILATNSETGETIESNVTLRKVVSEIPAPTVLTDLPATSSVQSNANYHVNASFYDTQQGTVKLYQVTEDETKDVTENYSIEEYTIDGLLHVHMTTKSGANESWASPAVFYMEATGYDGSTVRTSETIRTVITKKL